MTFGSDQPLISNQLADFEAPDTYEEFTGIFEREYKRVIDVINSKEGALYFPQELATFKRYFTSGNPQETRNVYRKVIDFGALPNAGSTSVAHNISFNAACNMTMCYGAATDTSNVLFIPLPFSSPTLNENVKLEVDATNVTITTGIDYSGYTVCTVVLEYTKN